jgi:hypothetical protein
MSSTVSPAESRGIARRTFLGGLGAVAVAGLAGRVSSAVVTPGVSGPGFTGRETTPTGTTVPAPTGEPTATSADELHNQYEGIAVVRFQNVTFAGEPLEPQELVFPASAILSAPLEHGGDTEQNPFSFSLDVGYETAGLPVEGSFWLRSAMGLYTPETKRPLLVEYWVLDYDEETGELVGELVDTHSDLGAAFNYLWVVDYPPEGLEYILDPEVFPHPIDERTTLEGQVTPEECRLTVRGTATGNLWSLEGAPGLIPFEAEITCPRVR